jgi:hypothetical protein
MEGRIMIRPLRKESWRSLVWCSSWSSPRIRSSGIFFPRDYQAGELGSGMRNMMRYGKAFGGEDLPFSIHYPRKQVSNPTTCIY